MKLISWNVNGIRSCLNKGFLSFASSSDADIIAIQETKAKEEDVDIELPGYERYFYSAEKKGYSGTAIFTRIKPISVTYGLDDDEYNHEGRVITLEYDDFYFVCVYVPNSQENLKRIDFRLGFDEAFRAHLVSLKKKKGVIATGDFNVAKEPIDLKNPKPNEGQCRIFHRRARELQENALRGLYRYFPVFLSR